MHILEININDLNELASFIIDYKNENNKEIKPGMKESIMESIKNLIYQKNSYGFKYISNENKILGYIMMHVVNFPMISGKELYITDLFIDKEQRGKGIGKEMLKKAEEVAIINDCVRIMLNNPRESEGYKRSFYKKNGFIERTSFANFIKETRTKE